MPGSELKGKGQTQMESWNEHILGGQLVNILLMKRKENVLAVRIHV